MLSLSLSCCPPLPCLRVGRKGEIALVEHTFRMVARAASVATLGAQQSGFMASLLARHASSPPSPLPPAAMNSHPTSPQPSASNPNLLQVLVLVLV